MAKLIQQDQCAGSDVTPSKQVVLQKKRAGERGVICVGWCPTCDAWVGTKPNGRLRTHINWRVRQSRDGR